MRASVVAALLFVLLALPAAAAPFEVSRSRASPAHAQVVLAPRAGDRATLVVLFQAGFYDEGGDAGLTRLTQHVLLEANARLPYAALLRELYAAGATLELDTGVREARFTLSAPARDFGKLAQALLKLTLAAQFDPRQYDAALERTQQDEELTRDALYERWFTTAVKADPAYRARAPARPSAIREYKLEDVRLHAARFFTPRNATVIAAGAFDARALSQQLRQLRGGQGQPLVRPELSLPVKLQVQAQRDVHVVAYPVALGGAREAAAVRVLAEVLYERMITGLRKQGRGYSFEAAPLLLPWLDTLVLTVPAQDSSGQNLSGALLQDVAQVRDGQTPEAALLQARDEVLARLRLADTQAEAVAGELAAGAHLPAWYGPALEAELQALTAEAFVQTVRPWLAETRRIHLVFTPRPPDRRSTAESRP